MERRKFLQTLGLTAVVTPKVAMAEIQTMVESSTISEPMEIAILAKDKEVARGKIVFEFSKKEMKNVEKIVLSISKPCVATGYKLYQGKRCWRKGVLPSSIHIAIGDTITFEKGEFQLLFN